MSAITTHVLDTAAGRPAAGVPVALEICDPQGRWEPVDDAVTDAGGRTGELAGVTGTHRLVFDVAAYLGEAAFFPEVAVCFRVAAHADELHIPLLLSPYGYSTYRGS